MSRNPKMTNRQKLRQAARKASRIVGTWPAWKRTILFYSLNATNPHPRPPIRSSTKAEGES
jgi:hypothetical protein